MSRSGNAEGSPDSNVGPPSILVEVPENVILSEPVRLRRAPWPITFATASGNCTGRSIWIVLWSARCAWTRRSWVILFDSATEAALTAAAVATSTFWTYSGEISSGP